MIKNDRQYRITKARAEEFERALAALAASPNEGLAFAIRKAQLDAARSQLEELKDELTEYEALLGGKERVLELSSLDELPSALIRARIASGMTQRDLADRIGIKEQQVQRYEATEYASASLSRIKEVVRALGLNIRKEVFLPTADPSLEHAFARLKSVGLDRDFVTHRLLPPDVVAAGNDNEPSHGAGLRLASVVNRVFGWTPSALFEDARPLGTTPALAARFKLPANADSTKTLVLGAYARYLAALVLRATAKQKEGTISFDAMAVRNTIVHAHGQLTLRGCLEYAWSCGIPVLPLHDGGGFHGATWRMGGRNVIVLKQSTRSEARWIMDFLHEFRHAGQDPSADEFELVDSEMLLTERRESEEEEEATTFAGDVMLDGRAEELAKKCVAEASGKVELLKMTVPRVASREGVRIDALANYMAYRLAMQGINWWGAATNLQETDESPWEVTRDFLIERLDFAVLPDIDRSLLFRALEG